MSRGSIRSREAYAQGKMMNHDGWAARLPRDITPSDVDFIIDNSGELLVAEFKRVEFDNQLASWSLVDYGQRETYRRLVMAGQGNVVAAVCLHNVPLTHDINTDTDVVCYALMEYHRALSGVVYSVSYCGGEHWAKWVSSMWWYKKPGQILVPKEHRL